MEEYNRIEISKVNHHIFGQVIFNKGAKTTAWGKNSFFQQIMGGKLDIHM